MVPLAPLLAELRSMFVIADRMPPAWLLDSTNHMVLSSVFLQHTVHFIGPPSVSTHCVCSWLCLELHLPPTNLPSQTHQLIHFFASIDLDGPTTHRGIKLKW